MTIFACFGPMISTEYLLLLLGIALGIEAILVSGIAFVISKALRIEMWKILGVGAIALLVAGTISIPLGWEETAGLTLSGGVVSGCLLAMVWLINLIRGGRKASNAF